MPGSYLKPVQSLTTSGARAVLPFTHEGVLYLAVPQLAEDIPGQAAQMTAGNSDVDTLVYKWTNGSFVEHGRIPLSGGEDAEFFRIGDRDFLAIASLRSGRGPYDFNSSSVVYQWSDRGLIPFQSFQTFAAKQWRYFRISDRHFLALAQGVVLAGLAATHSADSCIYEWNGMRFVEFQTISSRWGYNWIFFSFRGGQFLGFADHLDKSALYKWWGAAFELFQEIPGGGGRAFSFFEVDGDAYLAFANLLNASTLYRWDGRQFSPHQTLAGRGARELVSFEGKNGQYLLRVNFITGTQTDPQTALQSQVYQWHDSRLALVEEFPTYGGTDAAFFRIGNELLIAVSNSLSKDVRFRVDSMIYQFLD